ncbi:YncE family protein [Streptococcus sciuri]|uniref:YncE family protein n=1 Tax=Streptococcus sciuri TaxID=2973939 RepID=A0ABT2F711_9STRE|nr:YncE family protein [Streptococcus sciuri]MCS4487602.1 YncE family protein [Streptococcus sciuri]
MGKYAFITNTGSNTISVVDLQLNKEVKQIAIGDSPRGAMAIDRSRGFGFVSNCAGNTISVVNLKTGFEEKKIEVGLAPRGVDISPDNNTILITAFQRMMLTDIDLAYDRVSVVSLDNLTRVGDVPSGLGACSLNIIDSEEIEEFFVNNPYYMNMIAMA